MNENLKIALFTMIGMILMLVVFTALAPEEMRGPASVDQMYMDYNPLGDPSA